VMAVMIHEIHPQHNTPTKHVRVEVSCPGHQPSTAMLSYHTIKQTLSPNFMDTIYHTCRHCNTLLHL
jgi:hypothetical protein